MIARQPSQAAGHCCAAEAPQMFRRFSFFLEKGIDYHAPKLQRGEVMSHPERLLIETRNRAQVRVLVEQAGLNWLNQSLAREQWVGENEPAYHLGGLDGVPVRLLTLDEIEDYIRFARAVRSGEFTGSWVEWFVSGHALAAWRLARKTRVLQRLADGAPTKGSKGEM